MAKRLIIFICFALMSSSGFAQEWVHAQSVSKQFIVYGPKGTPYRNSVAKKFPLDPNFLTVSCERIKQVALTGIDSNEKFQPNLQNFGAGKIYIVLHPGIRQIPLITPVQSPTTLNYRVDLPDQIEGARLIETISEVVLLEIANRNGGETFVHLPQWLSRGIAGHVKSMSPETLLLQPNFPISQSKIKNDPIAKICKDLENYAPLNFAELSNPDILEPARAAHFDACAQLFVHELAQLKNNQSGLRNLLEELPHHPDWQTAFLSAFKSQFADLRDVEKWWGLRLVTLTGRDATRLWSRSQSMEMFDAALRVPMQRSAEKSNGRAETTLQEVVATWEPAQQKIALQNVVNQLRALRVRIQPELVILLDEYYGVLRNFLDNDEKQNLLKRIFVRQNLNDLRVATRERLDALDRLRTEVRNKPRPVTREEAMLSALEVASRNAEPAKK